MSRKRKPHQLSLITVSEDLHKFIGRRGWSLLFKPTEDGQVLAVSGSLQDVYDALTDWTTQHPDYFSAKIYRPSGALHRTIK